MKQFLPILSLLLFGATLLPAQSKKEIAASKAHSAVRLMDRGQIDESIKLLEEARALDPKNIDIDYELAYAYVLKQDYRKAIDLLTPHIDDKDANDRWFQLLGNSYDYLGDSTKAIETYKKGLQRYPNTGKLYLEIGNVYLMREEYLKALPYYEEGIYRDPTFPSNYYRATQIYCASSEKIWGVLYGELFMNLERNTQRTAEVSALLYETYRKAITIESKTSAGVDFSNTIAIDPSKEFRIPFQSHFGMTMTLSIIGHVLENQKDLDAHALHEIRTSFITHWYDQKRHEEFPNILFDFHQTLLREQHFEAYNHWIFMKGDEEAFNTWAEANPDKWERFVEWFGKNPMEISEKKRFHSGQY